jgi:transposase InsO family protein
MPQVLHKNARLTVHQRRMIRESTKPIRVLAKELGVSPTTVWKWKHRESPNDAPYGPREVKTSWEGWQVEAIKYLREKLRLPLDDLLEVVRAYIRPGCARSTLWDLLKREGIKSLRELKGKEKKGLGEFKEEREPGYLHLDVKELPKIGGERRYLFVAIDRATRVVYMKMYRRKGGEEAESFVRECVEFFPFKIRKVLTDNGKEFLSEAFRVYLEAAGIEHRRTKPYSPWTNGMAERYIGRVSEVLKEVRVKGYEELWEVLSVFWVDYMVYRRQRVLGGRTPFEVLMEKWRERPDIFWVDCRDHFRVLFNNLSRLDNPPVFPFSPLF